MRFITFILLLINITAQAQLNADFTASATQGCTDFTVQFKDKSSGSPASWFWDFGNGQTSALQNPTFTYTTSGKFTVRLTVKNSGAQDYEEKTNYITVFTSPLANFTVAGPDSGCVALQTSFADASSLFGTTIKSWLWDFKDGNTSSQQNPTHNFTTEGSYDVSLTITTTQGCSSTQTIYAAVIAGNKPVVSFSASPLKGCASSLRNFKDKTPGATTAYLWDFGDGKTSYEHNPQHHYQDTGLFDVKLKVSENGCIDSALIKDYLHIDGPAAKLNKKFDCSDRFTFTYKDLSVIETSRLWDFGDNQTSTLNTVTHTYSAPGVYYVKLYVTGTTCNDSIYDTLRIKTGNPVINISPNKKLYCRNDSLLFYATGFDSIASKAFAWNFRDGFTADFGKRLDSINYVYKQNGTYKPQLYIKNTDNCIDTITLNNAIEISGPTAAFQNSATGCTNTSMNFKDASVPAQGKPIQNWFWSFGDGGTDNTKGPLTYAYTFPGMYNANLTVTDIDGCTDTITNKIEIFDSPIVDAGLDTFACAGSTIPLNATGALNYTWTNNTDLSCTNCANPFATPQQSTTYFVTGTNNACSSADSINVMVQTKEPVTAEQDTYAICSGGNSVMLVANGADSYLWSPANTLSSTIVQNPVAFPSANTLYTVIGKDDKNCFADTATVNVIVNEKPDVRILDSVVQIMTGMTFTIPGFVSNDVKSYEWIPATGLSCTNCLNPVITVTGSTTYSLSGINEFGCTDTATISIIAACTGDAVFIPNTFSPNNDGMNDYFYPRSASSINIKSFNIFNRWGQLIFQNQNFSSNNSAYGWNGKYRNKLQDADVYIYVAELECGDGRVFIKKGNISLIR